MKQPVVSLQWFGGQSRVGERILSLFDRYKLPTSSYFDYTAGGLAIPLRIAMTRRGQNVTVNDRCRYTAIGARALLLELPQPIDFWIAKIPPVSERVRGVLTELVEEAHLSSRRILEKDTAFTQDVIQYVDAVATLCQDQNTLLLALGRTLLDATFRSLGWSRKTANGEVVSDWTPQSVFERMCYHLGGITLAQQKVAEQGGHHHVFCEDCDNLASVASTIHKDAVVYIDPAWPWSKKIGMGAKNPYFFLSGPLSDILSGVRVPPSHIRWDDYTDEQIMEELCKWIDGSFERGAHAFIPNNQTSNRPHPDFMEEFLRERYASQVVYSQRFSAHSMGHRTTRPASYDYAEHWWVILNEGEALL